MKKTLIAISAAILLAGCAKENLTDNGQPTGNGTPVSFGGVIVSEENDDQNRASFEDNGAVKIKWEAGDQIGIFGATTSESLGDNYAYDATPTGDGTSCTFLAADQGKVIGWGNGTGTRTFHAYFPHSAANLTKTGITTTVPATQTQTGNTMDHIADNALMIAEGVASDDPTQQVSFSFTHILPVIQFVLDADDPVTLASMTLTTTGDPLTGKATLDITKPFDNCISSKTATSKSITLSFGSTGLQLDGSASQNVYLLILPGTHAAGSFTVTFTDINGHIYTKNIWATKPLTFVANKKYKQQIANLSAVDFTSMSDFTVTSLGNSNYTVETPSVKGLDILIPLTSASPQGQQAIDVNYSYKDTDGQTQTGTLSFADVRDVQTLSVPAATTTRANVTLDYTVRLSYLPQLSNGNLDSWSNNSAGLPVPTGWAAANYKPAGMTIQGTLELSHDAGSCAQLQTKYNSLASIFYPATHGITAASLFTGNFVGGTDAANPRKMTYFGIPFFPSKEIAGLQVDIYYSGAAKGSNGQLDVDCGGITFELLSHDEGSTYEYHGYGTSTTGPSTDLTGTVTSDGYTCTATRVAAGACYPCNTSGHTIQVNGITKQTNYVAAGSWQTMTIPLTAVEAATGMTPNYLNISCTSSALGDQFLGNPNSELRLDNFTIIYAE